MIRVLAIIAVIGFLMSAICISAALVIGGPAAIARGAWSWSWTDHHPWMSRHPRDRPISGPTTTRKAPWTGSRTLEVDAPADIDYVQAPGPATLTITGPERMLQQLKVDGGRISLAGELRYGPRMRIELRAPAVSRFELRSVNRLAIADYHQDELNISIAGHGGVTGAGRAKSVILRIAGSGDVDLGDLKTAGATVEITGAGHARIAPSDWAKVDIPGAGEVELLTRPPRLESHISGIGSIRQPEPGGPRTGADAPSQPT